MDEDQLFLHQADQVRSEHLRDRRRSRIHQGAARPASYPPRGRTFRARRHLWYGGARHPVGGSVLALKQL